MAEIIVITGGSRSGKSGYAQKIAESNPGLKTFIATCPCLDDEMAERIRKHKEMRSSQWVTIEETVDLAGAVRLAQKSPAILVDCLTLWVNNLLYQAEIEGKTLDEEGMIRHCRQVLDTCARVPGRVIFVTNEVGMGIVPGDAVSRRFRDLAGRCNQIMVANAASVIFMISGVPLVVKGEIRV
jgi:adenosylcobinamide kinase/adenosylcobinamide-phosphate guanylyltransferase